MYWMQHQLLLHHRALQSDCHELHREVTHDLRVMQGLVFTPADHFMWHVPLLFMYFWTRLFWMLRFSKGARWACRPFSQTSSPGFNLFRNGLEDKFGGASGPHLCQLLAFCLSPAKDLPRPDPSLLTITVGIRD